MRGPQPVLRWQRGQKCEERAPKVMRRMGVPHLGQGSSVRPYAAKACSKKPLSPFTFMYKSSNEVPPFSIASCITSVAKSMIDTNFFLDRSAVEISG